MVWGAITYQGVGRLEFIDTRMTASSYIAILESQYALTVRMAGLSNETAILQQDNDPKHLAKETKMWLNANNIRLLSWPSCSPDMNIIENVWVYLKVRISSLREKPKNIIELKQKISQIRYSIPASYIQSLYNSIPARLNALYKAKGGYTKY